MNLEAHITQPLLEVQGLVGGYGEVTSLWGVDLEVFPKEITVVLGRNGAGKTSLLRAISGLLPSVSGGSIMLRGQELRGHQPAERVHLGLGHVQENKQIFRTRTVEENLLIGGFVLPGRALRSPARVAALEQAYARFPILQDKSKQLAGSLSGGQQQMLAIAQALCAQPALLMLDEPSAGLAPSIVQEVFDMVALLREEGLAVLLVEQVVDEAMRIADRVVVLETGRVHSSGLAAEFADSSSVTDMYLAR